ncbi:hypothetical protein MMC25_006745 [Agyrium rufum]|nr:hypothetical protein [Agyrium rufum]
MNIAEDNTAGYDESGHGQPADEAIAEGTGNSNDVPDNPPAGGQENEAPADDAGGDTGGDDGGE